MQWIQNGLKQTNNEFIEACTKIFIISLNKISSKAISCSDNKVFKPNNLLKLKHKKIERLIDVTHIPRLF